MKPRTRMTLRWMAWALVAFTASLDHAVGQERPEPLAIGAEGARFRVEQRDSATIPGSRGQVEVFLDDITRGQVRLGIRTADGVALVPPRSMREGDIANFRVGESSYSLRVDKLRNKLIGTDSAELSVTPGAAPDTVPPIARLAQRAVAGLVSAADDLDRAEDQLQEVEQARASLQAARQDLARARFDLTGRPLHRLAIEPSGTQFIVEEDTADGLPGSHGWLEVALGDITRGRVTLEVRTIDGDVLAGPRPVSIGDEVPARVGEQDYAIRVSRLHDYIDLLGFRHDEAYLQVIAVETERGGAPVPVLGDPTGREPVDREPVPVALLEVIQAKIERTERDLLAAETSLVEDNVPDAIAALEDARTRHEHASNALRVLGELASRHAYWTLGDLSVVRVRIEGELPGLPEPDLSALTPKEKAVFGSIHGAGTLFSRLIGLQDLDARILEVRTIGSRYASRTRLGKENLGRRRPGVRAGRRIVLEHYKPDTGIDRLVAGQEYWVAITPRVAYKAFPREAGTGNHTLIVFAIPADADR